MENKSFYTRVEYGQIRGYTMEIYDNMGIDRFAFCISMNKTPYTPLLNISGEI